MNNTSGPGLVEYAAVLLVVAAVTIGLLLFFGASLIEGIQAGNPVSIFIGIIWLIAALGAIFHPRRH